MATDPREAGGLGNLGVPIAFYPDWMIAADALTNLHTKDANPDAKMVRLHLRKTRQYWKSASKAVPSRMILGEQETEG